MTREPVVPPNAVVAQVALRWADSDSLGHVNNVAMMRLLEEARVRLFSANSEHGIGVLAARHEVDYLRPLFYGPEPVAIHTWVERIGSASFTVAHLVRSPSGQGVCAAKTVIVAIDPASGASTPLPEAVRAQLATLVA